MSIASEQETTKPLSDLMEPGSTLMVGTTAVIWSNEIPQDPAKIALKWAKDQPKFTIKGGFYEGQVAALNVKPLTQVALMGVLRPQLDSVNMVNAPVIARERGIEVAEVKHERDSDYHSMIRISVTTDKYTRSITGTLFGGKHPRIVEIKGIEIEAEFSPHMLYITNDDKPGFIGRLGTLLGENQVNIATFHLGRDKPGGSAIAIVQVDQPLSPALTARIAAVEGVVQAKALGF